MRPAYFSFELLARITGDRLYTSSNNDAVHAFLSYDKSYGLYSLLFWNFSSEPVSVSLHASGVSGKLIAKRRMLDAETPVEDENSRLRPLPDITLEEEKPAEVLLPAYGIQFMSLEPLHWPEQLLRARPIASGL